MYTHVDVTVTNITFQRYIAGALERNPTSTDHDIGDKN